MNIKIWETYFKARNEVMEKEKEKFVWSEYEMVKYIINELNFARTFYFKLEASITKSSKKET